MKEILKYTKMWLDVVLNEGKQVDGHDFFSMIKGNTKDLYGQGIKLNDSMDGVYYALCLVSDFISDEIRKNGSNHWTWDFIKDESLKKEPLMHWESDRILAWNLWHQLKSVKRVIDSQISQS